MVLRFAHPFFLLLHTHGGTLGCLTLATSTADTHAVDNITLLGLVTQAAGLVGARWAGSAVDDSELSELYYALSAKFNECIAEASSEDDAHNQTRSARGPSQSSDMSLSRGAD